MLAASTAALPAADDFWTAKPASEWTQQEVEKLLANSPWAETMTIARGAVVFGAGVGRGMPKRRPRAAGSPVTVELNIRWQSARPVREAMGAQARLTGRNLAPAARRMLDADPDGYVIVVRGLPANLARISGESRMTLQRGATLEAPKSDPVPAAALDLRRDGGAVELRLAFPEILRPEHDSAVFRLELGSATIKHKFDLRKMIFLGERAL